MAWKIQTNALKHTVANGYHCSDQTCPCQHGHAETTITQAHTWALKPGSRDCAWCNDEAGLPQGNGSHGICRKHSAQLIARAKARRAQ